MWATIWAGVSALASVLILAAAVWALLRWRKQDELKAKLEFKQGIARLGYCLSRMPDKITLPEREKSKERLAELKDHMSQCTYSWLASEGLMEKYPDVVKNWEYINENINQYYWGRMDRDSIGESCAAILLQKFVFK
ncbi:hypothetical protein AM363_12770 [Citrobacter freundii]|uniref:DUF4760 domain-containing protein n=1 Tax=Citrobacter freundii TaxID=546 RepID=A0AB33HBN3_CITFR|nr:hypothetical protein [Citrobacter freundii]AXZ47751.1 hypothetical protein AM363_12770 [Citrobacter freundii]